MKGIAKGTRFESGPQTNNEISEKKNTQRSLPSVEACEHSNGCGKAGMPQIALFPPFILENPSNTSLVGGFNPLFSTYSSKWVHLPQVSGSKQKKSLTPPPRIVDFDDMGVSKNSDTSKWMAYNGKPHQNG